MHVYVKPTKVKFISNKFNNYHSNINFEFGLEKNNEINFFKVLVKRANKLETGVYQKPTSADIYIN